MSSTVLITGGAGFIGTALARQLRRDGDEVVVFDCLHPQIHTPSGRPMGLPSDVMLLTGDVAHAPDLQTALKLVRPDVVVHLAAETGTGQSLTESTRHGRVNVVGTTTVLDALLHADAVPDHLVLSSSRAVYGEGAWEAGGAVFYPGQRTHADLAAGRWNPSGPDGVVARHLPSRADTTVPHPTSVYGATKLAQEHIISAWAGGTGSAVSILRLQNVYGPGQALANPYTGIVSLFARLAKAGEVIDVYEDGEILRDFVYIDDVVTALARAIHDPPQATRLLDVGSGSPTTIASLAGTVVALTSAPPPVVTGKFRDGDVRCASCDIAPAVAELGVTPRVDIASGLRLLLDWIGEQPVEARGS